MASKIALLSGLVTPVGAWLAAGSC